MRRTGMIFTVLALGLAACGPAPSKPQAGAPAAPAAPAFVDQITPGEWRTTITISEMNAPNLPPALVKQMAASGPIVVTDCVTSADVAEFGKKTVAQEENCAENNVTFAGGKIGGTLVCAEDGRTVRSSYSGTYTATRMEMAASVESDLGPVGKMTSKAQVTAERLGECKS